MSWLFEDSTTVIAVGVLIEFLLVVTLVKTGRASILLGMLGVAVVVGACVLVEYLVVTDGERIEAVIHDVTRAFVANDVDKVTGHISSEAPELRSRAAAVMKMARFSNVQITDGPRITIHELTSPRTAEAELVVRATADTTAGTSLYKNYPRRINTTLQEEAGQWRFLEATHAPPFGQ